MVALVRLAVRRAPVCAARVRSFARRVSRFPQTLRVGAALAALTVLAACAGRMPARGRPTVPGGAPTSSVPAAIATSDEDVAYLTERELLVPVAGVRAARLVGSFDAPRSGERVHRALDILAPRGTPILAADEGRIWKLRSNALGGITIYTVDPLDRWVFYYAHLDHYRDGLTEGALVAKGDTLGFVGTTGNAPPDTPHLHFQVMRLGADRRWWAGAPIDPLPFLRRADEARALRAAYAATVAHGAGRPSVPGPVDSSGVAGH